MDLPDPKDAFEVIDPHIQPINEAVIQLWNRIADATIAIKRDLTPDGVAGGRVLVSLIATACNFTEPDYGEPFAGTSWPAASPPCSPRHPYPSPAKWRSDAIPPNPQP